MRTFTLCCWQSALRSSVLFRKSSSAYARLKFDCSRIRQAVAPTHIDSRSVGPHVVLIYTAEFILPNNDIALRYLLTRPVYQIIRHSKHHELRLPKLPTVATMASVAQLGGPDLI